MIITESYEGLEKEGSYYKLNGDLITDEDLIINVPLICTGMIKSGKSIKAGWSIKAGESIKAGWSITAGESIEAELIKMCGIETTKIKIISGLVYKIWIMDTHIKIGCEIHEKKEWSEFSDRDILKMDGNKALKFWNENKKWILAC